MSDESSIILPTASFTGSVLVPGSDAGMRLLYSSIVPSPANKARLAHALTAEPVTIWYALEQGPLTISVVDVLHYSQVEEDKETGEVARKYRLRFITSDATVYETTSLSAAQCVAKIFQAIGAPPWITGQPIKFAKVISPTTKRPRLSVSIPAVSESPSDTTSPSPSPSNSSDPTVPPTAAPGSRRRS